MLRNVTLDQMRVLVAIEDTGSFSAAGRKLLRAQSAISNAVQSLEEGLQLTFFDRSSRTPVLTDAGRAIVLQARHVLRQVDLLERSARAIVDGQEPELTIAVDAMVPNADLIRNLGGLRERFPDLALTLFTDILGGPVRKVRSEAAALALCYMSPTQAQDLQAYPVTSIETLTVVSPSHPLARETRPLVREVLAEHVQLVMTDTSDQDAPNYGIISPRIWRFVDLTRRLDFLLGGFGWATMPTHLVEPYLRSGDLIHLSIPDTSIVPCTIPIYAVHLRSRPLGVAARWLLDRLRDSYSSNSKDV